MADEALWAQEENTVLKQRLKSTQSQIQEKNDLLGKAVAMVKVKDSELRKLRADLALATKKQQKNRSGGWKP